MKFLLVSIALVFALAVYQAEAKNLGMKARFNTWKARFGKRNDDPATEEKRMCIFENITNLIDNHNEKFLNGDALFSLDLNEHSAALENEIQGKGFLNPFRGLHKRSIGTENIKAHILFHPYHYNPAVKASPARDWRTVWTKAATNQGVCGSCWAFATASVVESTLKIKKGIDVDLSEQQLVDCGDSFGNGACGGGVPLYALEYVQTKGLTSEAAYPYHDGTHHTATPHQCAVPASTSYKIDGLVSVDRGDDRALMQAIDELGPCAVAIDVGGSGQTRDASIYPEFNNYKSGIYTVGCSSAPEAADHAVVVVGYGTSTAGVPYWIIRNSWGTTWGDKGYMLMDRRKANMCGISNQAVCAVVNKY